MYWENLQTNNWPSILPTLTFCWFHKSVYIRLHKYCRSIQGILVRCLKGLVHYLRFVKLCKSHLRHLFQPWIFYIIYCCNFPWVCKTVMLFLVTVYARFIYKRDRSPLLFCVLWLFRLVTKYFIIVSVWLEYNLNPYDRCLILWNKWFFIWTWILIIWLN